ncbi:MAG: CRISPR-associated exonuclease, Cas4 family [uncultured Thiotrichaceae bacterium]|uniref:CRISPR-associated exonuclease, Cas4 family n=1 Tax=uncultured Thiotrichaceae bacterium TaxID=298394 RepID=A0A6S6TJM5_9GAMM|nr:MAG: CRISPR-associated exonuclease, Cas4 family [uncultured Thiotrichaceae bacterium]
MSEFDWPKSKAFQQRVENLNLHGLHFQHVELCERRAWMYLHKVNFAQWHSRVATGTAKHETSYQRDHSVRGLFGLAPDRIDWDKHIVYENKGTGGAVEASSNQTAFYAVMLSIATGQAWKAYMHVLTTRRKREVVLDAVRLEKLWSASQRLAALMDQQDVPPAQKIPLCKTCSLALFCGHD